MFTEYIIPCDRVDVPRCEFPSVVEREIYRTMIGNHITVDSPSMEQASYPRRHFRDFERFPYIHYHHIEQFAPRSLSAPSLLNVNTFSSLLSDARRMVALRININSLLPTIKQSPHATKTPRSCRFRLGKPSNLLDIIRRNALRNTPLFHIRPPISTIVTYKDKPLTLAHIPLRITSRLVIVQRFDVL